jgi:hypothetical protein
MKANPKRPKRRKTEPPFFYKGVLKYGKIEIGVGRTIEDAVTDALSRLAVDRDLVNIEVLETPSKGFLGIGASLAKVKLTADFEEKTALWNFWKMCSV